METLNTTNTITTLITGHNVKWSAILCIESLIKNSMFDYEDIVFFDDNSTDGTREELEKRGIKVITWDEDTHNKLQNSPCDDDLRVRVSMILNSAYKQLETIFLFVVDADTVFFKDPMPTIIPLIDNVSISAIRRVVGNGSTSMPNIDHKFCFMNLYNLKKYGILGDDIEDFEDNLDKADIYDTGFSFYKKINTNNVPINYIESSSETCKQLMNGEISLHFGAISSSMRKDVLMDGMDYVDRLKNFLNLSAVRPLLTEFGIDEEVFIKEYENNLFKSKVFD